jgi:hypothetical protein
MSDALSFVEIDGQHVELLPARTVMSAFRMAAATVATVATVAPLRAVSALTC